MQLEILSFLTSVYQSVVLVINMISTRSHLFKSPALNILRYLKMPHTYNLLLICSTLETGRLVVPHRSRFARQPVC